MDYKMKKCVRCDDERLSYQSYCRKHHNQITLETLKRNNYNTEKTESQRKVRYIKRKTRYHFPLKDQICVNCKSNLAVERHHTTAPIEFDKFKFLCHDCHTTVHNQKEVIII